MIIIYFVMGMCEHFFHKLHSIFTLHLQSSCNAGFQCLQDLESIIYIQQLLAKRSECCITHRDNFFDLL